MVERAQKCKIIAIDHIVLTVHDLAKTISFYCDVLGMELETFLPFEGGKERKSLRFGDYKINIMITVGFYFGSGFFENKPWLMI